MAGENPDTDIPDQVGIDSKPTLLYVPIIKSVQPWAGFLGYSIGRRTHRLNATNSESPWPRQPAHTQSGRIGRRTGCQYCSQASTMKLVSGNDSPNIRRRSVVAATDAAT